MQGFGRKAARMSLVAAFSACLGLGGCMGSAGTVQQGKDLYSAGIQYTEALDMLLNVTIETVIDYDSDELIRQRRHADPNDLRGFLEERNQALVEQVKTLETFRNDGRRLHAYFVSLQGLADARLQQSAAAAVGDLSASIAAANGSLKKSQHLSLSEQEQAAVSQFGGLVAKGVHAEAVKRALRRDAPVMRPQMQEFRKSAPVSFMNEPRVLTLASGRTL